MIANLAMLARGDAENAIWDIEDAELLAAAQEALGRFERATNRPPNLALQRTRCAGR